MALGRADEAIPWLQQAMDAPRYEAPHFPHVNLARVYETQGRPLDALAQYGRALEKLPGYEPALAGLRRLQARVN
jgi:Tfp pilus assembly protein PilF